ncbi:MAG: aminopeptidase [Opitutales bacterium]|nr:aminopeptidase [Opitutales bacterium]MCH8540927.1 aminopeptidase [Opitutales bacterium]
MDSRFIDLAEVLSGHSVRLSKGDRVFIEAFDIPAEMVSALLRVTRAKGAEPFVQWHHAETTREWIREGSAEAFAAHAEVEMARMKKMDAYVAIRGSHNIFETSDIPAEQMKAYLQAMKPVLDQRVNETRWVVLRWPTAAMAQQARMSTEAFRDFYFRVCTMDYARMIPGMEALKARMEAADRVEIKGPGTDLRFSIKGIPAKCCGGEHNIPDGEVFTAPVKESVEGEISFNAPTVYQGNSFDRIRLVFAQGKIIEASGDNQEKLNEILDADAGARFIGEFAIAFNPHITEPMRDILFDEKIAGSFHFTPGQAYEIADNGNRSQVHWDMVQLQDPANGGGTIAFDGEVIRRDGLFVVEDLQKLNPEYLLG